MATLHVQGKVEARADAVLCGGQWLTGTWELRQASNRDGYVWACATDRRRLWARAVDGWRELGEGDGIAEDSLWDALASLADQLPSPDGVPAHLLPHLTDLMAAAGYPGVAAALREEEARR